MTKTAIRSETGRIIRGAGAETRSLPAILSTGEIARDGHRVDPKGWVHPSTVPFVDSHRDADGIRSVLGNVSFIRTGTADLDSGYRVPALVGTVNYATATVNPDAEVAYQLALAGFAPGLSVGFIPIEAKPATERGRRSGALDIAAAELLEVSCVAIPSDSSAKVLARSFSRRLSGCETAADRRIIAEAIQRRIARDSAAFDERRDCATREDRARRVYELTGRWP